MWHRENTGQGQHVDVAISEYIATILENALSMYSYTGASFTRTGNRGYGRAAWGPYPCADGYVGVIGAPDHRWPAMADIMEIPALAELRFATRAGREEHADELDALMLPWLAQHEKQEIFERAQQRGLGFAYVATPGEILQLEHLREREYFARVEHPEAGTLQHPTGPFKIQGMEWRMEPAPLLGQHNVEVLCGRLGYSREDLVKLRQANAI